MKFNVTIDIAKLGGDGHCDLVDILQGVVAMVRNDEIPLAKELRSMGGSQPVVGKVWLSD